MPPTYDLRRDASEVARQPFRGLDASSETDNPLSGVAGHLVSLFGGTLYGASIRLPGYVWKTPRHFRHLVEGVDQLCCSLRTENEMVPVVAHPPEVVSENLHRFNSFQLRFTHY